MCVVGGLPSSVLACVAKLGNIPLFVTMLGVSYPLIWMLGFRGAAIGSCSFSFLCCLSHWSCHERFFLASGHPGSGLQPGFPCFFLWSYILCPEPKVSKNMCSLWSYILSFETMHFGEAATLGETFFFGAINLKQVTVPTEINLVSKVKLHNSNFQKSVLIEIVFPRQEDCSHKKLNILSTRTFLKPVAKKTKNIYTCNVRSATQVTDA